jgi:predicted neuraminidase
MKNISISTDQLTYIGAALGVAVLVLALVLLTFCRIKRRRAAFVSGMTETDQPPCFLHNEPTETITCKPFTTVLYLYWDLSFLSLQRKAKARMNVQETLGRTASFPPH